MAYLDKTTGLFYLTKRPSPEKRLYSVDFKEFLVSISSIDSISVSTAGDNISPLVISDQYSSGTIVYFNLSYGTDGVDYEITIVVTDNLGNIISEDILIKVRKAGVI